MTDIPPLPPDTPEADYASIQRQDARNGMAVAALVCGIIGLVMCPIVAPVAIILAIIALVRASNLAPFYTGRGMAIGGLVTGVVGMCTVPLLLSIFLPSLTRAREVAKRAVCASNIRGIGQGMKVYSNDNMDWYPIAPYDMTPANGPEYAASVAFVGNMGYRYMDELVEDELNEVHPSRSLFMLVTNAVCTTKQFICPSSADSVDDLRNGNAAAMPGVDRFDFLGYPHESYGYQLPFGPKARPNENLDVRMVILADKGPLYVAGMPAPEGHIPDRPDVEPGTRVVFGGSSAEEADALIMAGNDEWESLNSRNHGGEGQNVLFQDGHVEFAKKPIVGVNGDNIYSRQAGPTMLDILLGITPNDYEGPLTNTDSVIVP